ncbi:MAG: transaldolase [Gemmatimonadetes bacterium]|nr:transaldolase [Gemmatimonadota bacterium]
MTPSRLHALAAAGTSTWLDYIDRGMLASGGLGRRIREDALAGMTSNPTIFEKALAEGAAYDAQVQAGAGMPSRALFEQLATNDVREACDQFSGVYRDTAGVDGYVSIEVSPDLHGDAAGTVVEARRLWKTIARPNVMIKVPGTDAGAGAIRTLIGEGINVNVTLLFAVEAHDAVIEAYLAGLEDRAGAGHAIDRVASVASFFVSRVDTEVDKRLDAMIATADAWGRTVLAALKGRAAIANARLAYELFERRFAGARWAALAARGARVQRPLWASTGTKNPAYRDVLYVEQLVGPLTVNTMPPATLDAFRDHGEVRDTLRGTAAGARATIAALASHGIAMPDVTAKLLAEGLASFEKSFVTLLGGLERKTAALGAHAAGAMQGAR